MTPWHIDGATRVIGESQGYIGLPLRDQTTHCAVSGENTPVMVSQWTFTDYEREMISQGADIQLFVIGTRHPPVLLELAQ
ncbi:hypothetical protein [Bosea sp. LjRoot237]|uniref:hypothetical protein n=1 Tax=Bosea sp. LjRoot237 TaxID=3342292 RepID=UPI003ECDA997